MSDILARIAERQIEITAQIAALVAERDELDAAQRVFARLSVEAHPKGAADGESPSPVADGQPAHNAGGDNEEVARTVTGFETAPQSDGEGRVKMENMAAGADAGPGADSVALRSDVEPVAPHSPEQAHEVTASRARKPSPEQSEAEPVRQAGGGTSRRGPHRDPNSLLGRVRAYMAEHPATTMRECADALGAPYEKVKNTASGFVAFLPAKRGPNENTVRRRPSLPPEAKDAPVASEPPKPVLASPELTGGQAGGDQRAALSGKRFWLVDDKNRYLNRFGTGFTDDRRNAWDGNERQLAGIRRSVAIARDLREKPVTKDIAVPVNREVA